MVLSLIFGHKYAQGQVKNSQSGVAIVSFDTVVSEEHKFTSRVTYYPVENGTIVSDHIINQPDLVSISGVVSDSPLNILASFNRSVAAFNSLIQIHQRKQVVDIVTGIKIYKNMALVSLDVPRNLKTGQTLTFNLEFQKIIYDDDLTVLSSIGNVFAGVQDNTPSTIVAQNTNIPFIQNDPAYSLKDQASTAINLGIQGLDAVPSAILPNVLVNLGAIRGYNANNTI